MKTHDSICYFDCNSTTPIEPDVLEAMRAYLTDEFGNASSRTHEYGARANRAVGKARSQIADVVDAEPSEVIFTSGATESNNIAIFGLENYAREGNKLHIITSSIEHKAVLEPFGILGERGFDVTYIAPTGGGWVDPSDIANALRPDTAFVSIMHVNNETGIIQPIEEICDALDGHDAYFHTDAAQGFGKDIKRLQNSRIDLISISGHKIYGPKGIGALIARKREGIDSLPLTPIMYGGGQERGIRPGTLPVHLIAGLGKASEIAQNNNVERAEKCTAIRNALKSNFSELNPIYHGDPERQLPHIVNVSFDNIDSEAIMLVLKDLVAISNGSACNSSKYEPSHVLAAMNLSQENLLSSTRWSWSHLSNAPEWNKIVTTIKSLY